MNPFIHFHKHEIRSPLEIHSKKHMDSSTNKEKERSGIITFIPNPHLHRLIVHIHHASNHPRLTYISNSSNTSKSYKLIKHNNRSLLYPSHTHTHTHTHNPFHFLISHSWVFHLDTIFFFLFFECVGGNASYCERSNNKENATSKSFERSDSPPLLQRKRSHCLESDPCHRFQSICICSSSQRQLHPGPSCHKWIEDPV